VPQGTVKWFDPEKGYGFIKPDDGGPDVYVNLAQVQQAGYFTLKGKAHISYDLNPGRAGARMSAENLRFGS
jgi:CspA family cold shock protein